MRMRNGLYRTAAGSTVRVSGKHSGIIEISFDWVEENNACIDCEASVVEGCLEWGCDAGHYDSAELIRVEESNGI